jgi:hypothetical protein
MMRKLSLICMAALLVVPLFAASASAQNAGMRSSGMGPGPNAVNTAPSATAGSKMRSPSAAAVEAMANATSAAPFGVAGASSGFDGVRALPGSGGVGSQAYGPGSAGKFPYTTKRVASWTNNGPGAGLDDPVTEYPWRATGKLWARWGTSWFVCTASLIKPSVLITAAHCVHVYGTQNGTSASNGYADEVRWYPAQYGGVFPYGAYLGRYWYVPTPYWNGTDTCTTVGVVCNNDLAIVVLWENNGLLANDAEAQAGDIVGWYAYSWNGYSFITSPYLGNRFAGQITELGYPQAIDSGQRQIRTDSAGVYFQSGNLRNINIGTAQTGGSSGGPWLVNFGTPPVHNAGSSAGTSAAQAVATVTSWGYISLDHKVQGASWFGQNVQFPAADYGGHGAGNIGRVVWQACAVFPAACV